MNMIPVYSIDLFCVAWLVMAKAMFEANPEMDLTPEFLRAASEASLWLIWRLEPLLPILSSLGLSSLGHAQ